MPFEPKRGFHDLNGSNGQICWCLVYRREEARAETVARYVQEGFDRQQRALLIVPAAQQKGLRAALAEQGLAVDETEGCGRLTFATAEGLGLVTAPSPAAAVECLAAVGRRAQAQGEPGVRIYWEMAGAVLEKDLHWLTECLAASERLTASAPIALLAGYDRRQVASALLVEALRCFPAILEQGRVFYNSCYQSLAGTGAVSRRGGLFGAADQGGGLRVRPNKRPYRRGQVLDAIFAAAPIGLWLLDREQRMVFINQHFCAATGISEEAFLQAPHYSQVMRPEEAIECMLSDARAYSAAGPLENEETISSADGSSHVYRVVKTKVVNSEQEVEGLLGLAIDITDRKQAEYRLRQSEARFRDIALSMADFIWEIDAQGCFCYCSEQVEEMLGYSPAQLSGRSCFDMFPEREARRLEELLREAASRKAAFRSLQSWVVDSAGRRRFLCISGVPILDEKGTFQGFRGVTEDVTARKRAEASLQRALIETAQAREQVDNILKSIADGLIVTGPRKHQIVLINETARELLNCGDRQLIGRPLTESLQDARLLEQIAAIYDDGTPSLLQTDLVLPAAAGDSGRVLQARTSLMRNRQGQVGGAITVLRDVTRERELERRKAEFMSMAAHELRTPLTAILGYAELCMNPADFGGFSETQQKEFVAEIYNKAEVLANLVNDLLDIGRLETGRPLPLNIERVAIGPILSKVVDRYRLLAPGHPFELDLARDLPDDLPADSDKLEQVLENLISNAVKYSAEGRPIRIGAERRGGYCQVSVADQGIGMAEDQVARVFDKFYRADFSNTAAKGLGVGMSIARQIVEQHGGAIYVESAPGQGTTVVFTVPLQD